MSSPFTIDISSLPAPAQKILSPQAPPKLKEMAAKGIAPGLKPADALGVLVLLRESDTKELAGTAAHTLSALPEQLLSGALASDLHPAVIDALARLYPDRLDLQEKLLRMPRISEQTVLFLAQTANEALSELIAVNEERLLAYPAIIEKLYMNKHTRSSTADRMIDLAARNHIELAGLPAFKEACAALEGEPIMEPSDEPLPDDVLFQETQQIAEQLSSHPEEDTHTETPEGKEVVKEKFLPLYRRIAMMTVSQKVRRAILGTKEERMLLIRDSNRIVASSAARSPLMQEPEVVLLTRNRNISDEVLRIIAMTPEWLKSYPIKKNLVENPKTPPALATRLVTQLRESDLKHVAKSKNVTDAVQEAARRHLNRRST